MENNEKTLTVAIACSLNTSELMKRKQELQQDIFSQTEEITELEDAMCFTFPSSDSLSLRLIEFINVERQCCPFFSFKLVFKPHQGTILLEIGGSKEIKETLKCFINN